jgi:hypothetical protein
MHRARHSEASSSAFRPRQAVALVAAVAGLATAIWLPTRFDSAEATDRRGDRAGQGERRPALDTVTFVDRFAGDRGEAADREKWAVPEEDERAVRLEGFGTLAIAARGGDTSRMVTRQPIEQAQGRLEARIELPDGRDARPSLFLARDADESGVDLLDPIRRAEPRAFGEGFHSVTVDWDADLAVASVDGDEVFRVRRDQVGNDAWLFDGPFFVGLSLSADDDAASRLRYAPRLLVDLVRVSTDDPAASEPPATEPTEPPATEPPATTPPATTPPATTPPATTPPTSAPPATTAPPAAAAWKPFTLYRAGDRVTFGGVTYEVKEAHTSLPAWQPPAVPNLFKPLG